MMGLHDDTCLTFGKFRGRSVSNTPSSYLKWCLEQDWFDRKYEELVPFFEEELNWRTTWNQHFEDEREIRY